MKGLIKAGRFNIKFNRDYVSKTVINKKKETETVKTPLITCAVIYDEAGNALSSGMCTCYYKDNFSKEKGRVVALKRAIDLLSLPKEERAEIWNGYRNR